MKRYKIKVWYKKRIGRGLGEVDIEASSRKEAKIKIKQARGRDCVFEIISEEEV